MIDFAILQGLEIAEGEVTEIADAAGNVLWSAVVPMCIVTIPSHYYRNNAYLYYMAGNDEITISDAGSYEIQAGTKVVACFRGAGLSVGIYYYPKGSTAPSEEITGYGEMLEYEFTIKTGIVVEFVAPSKGTDVMNIYEQ